MIGGLLKSTSRLAIVAAAGLAAGSVAAQAADLGGNCCADLEERVAELEATAARKGTRRMGVQIYGQVSETVMYWDDGGERNAYVLEQNGEQNRFGVQGSAKIDQDLSAGFKMEWQVRAFRSSSADQAARGDNEGLTHTTFNTQALALKHAYWYLRSTSLGTLSVGQQSDSASGVLSINLAETDGFSATDAGYAIRDFRLRIKGQAPGNDGLSDKIWRETAFVRNGDGPNSFDYTRAASVRYTTPTFAGFTASASWGEDDYWSAALRYAGELGPFRVAAGIGYSDWRDLGRHGCASLDGAEATATTSAVNCTSLQAGGSIMHKATGLFVSGGWAQITDDNRRTAATAVGIPTTRAIDNTDEYWWIQGGWEAKLNALGNTTFWADYQEWNVGLRIRGHVVDTVAGTDPLNSFATTSNILHTNASSWGIGVTQEIDAAEMNLYLGYRNFTTDVTLLNSNVVGKSNPIEDMQILYSGATVKF